MQIKTEAKIGLMVAATLVLVYWGINFLKGRNVLNRTDVYYAMYSDVSGLDISSPVVLNGYNVGLVTDIGFSEDKADQMLVTFTVDHSIEIPEGSKAELYSADPLGSKAIQIIRSNEKTMHEFGDTLNSSFKPDMLSLLGDEFAPIAARLDTSLERINLLLASFLEKETIEHFKKGVASLDELTASLNKQLAGDKIQKTISSLENFMKELNANSDKLEGIFTNLENISDSLALSNITQMVSNAEKSFAQAGIMLENINSGNGSLGQLATNDSLYLHLNASLESLNLLIRDLNENPGRYVKFSVFGGKK